MLSYISVYQPSTVHHSCFAEVIIIKIIS